MNAKTTWILVSLALGLFAYILFVDIPARRNQLANSASQLFPGFNPSSIRSVEVSVPTNLILRAERTNDSWELVLPIRYPAPSTQIDSLLQVFSQLNRQSHISAQELLTQNLPLKSFGLDPPQMRLIAEGPTRLEMKIGGKTPVGNQVYVQLVGIEGVFFTDAALLRRMPATVDDWRDKRLLDLENTQFNRLEVRYGASGGYQLKIDPSTLLWRLTQPLQARADNPRIALLRNELQSWQISQFIPPNLVTNLEAFGLQNPKCVLTVGLGTNDLQEIQFGDTVPQQTNLVYVLCLPRNSVVMAPRLLMDQIRVPYTEFRDRRLLSAFPVDFIEVSAIEPFRVERDKNGQWQVQRADYAPFPADPELMSVFLTNLFSLRVSEFVKDVATDWAGYGLDPSPCQYRIGVKTPGGTNRIIAHISFGDLNKEPVYGRRLDEGSVYAIPRPQVAVLPFSAFELRHRQIWSFAPSNVLSFCFVHQDESRKVLRNASQQWVLAPQMSALPDPLPRMLDELAIRFGQLKAEAWSAQGDEFLQKLAFYDPKRSLTVELGPAGKTQTLSIDFGGKVASRNRVYASLLLKNQRLIFELGLTTYYDLFFEIMRTLFNAPQKMAG